MKVLEGKIISEKIEIDLKERKKRLKIEPNIVVLGIEGDEASKVYVSRIKKNCEKYGIKTTVNIANNEEDFISCFNEIKNNENITGVMFQQPLPPKLSELINELPTEKDVEGIGINNMGKLFLGKKEALIPCTSKAVIEVIDYYNIDLTGKKVVIVGRSNIVGKPLIPQLLEKNATLTICHSKTNNLKEITQTADVIIMAIGKAKFLKRDYIKKGAILIDVGINIEDGKVVGDVDFEDIKDKAEMCTPVPRGIGIVTNSLLIDNIIRSAQMQEN